MRKVEKDACGGYNSEKEAEAMKNRGRIVGMVFCGTLGVVSCSGGPKEIQSMNQAFQCLSAALEKNESEREKIRKSNEITWRFAFISSSEKGKIERNGTFNIDQAKMENDDLSGLEGDYVDEIGAYSFRENRFYLAEGEKKEVYDVEMTKTEFLDYLLPFDVRYVNLFSVVDHRVFDWLAMELTSDQIFDYYVSEISTVSSLNVSSLITKKDRKLLVDSLDVVREQVHRSFSYGGTTARIEFVADAEGVAAVFDAVSADVKSAIKAIDGAEYSTIYSKAVENIYRTIGAELEKNEENVKKTENLNIAFPIERDRVSAVLLNYTFSGESFSDEFRSDWAKGYAELQTVDANEFIDRGPIGPNGKSDDSTNR